MKGLNGIYYIPSIVCVILGSFDPLCVHWFDLTALQAAGEGVGLCRMLHTANMILEMEIKSNSKMQKDTCVSIIGCYRVVSHRHDVDCDLCTDHLHLNISPNAPQVKRPNLLRCLCTHQSVCLSFTLGVSQ